MDAARWCFVLICHTLLTERERGKERREESENQKETKKNKKRCLLIVKSEHCGLEQTSTV